MLGLLGSVGGSLLSGIFGMMGQSSANAQAEQMAATRYQTSSSDMMKAGLNPAMMFGSGGPAPMAPVQNTMAAPAAALKDAASSAVAMQVADKTIDQLTEQIAKTNAEAANVRAATPGIAASSSISSREADAIGKIPDKIYIPIVQSGYGADKLKSTGRIGSSIGAGVSSAKSVLQGVGAGIRGLSGPVETSARAVDKSMSTSVPAKWLKRKFPFTPWGSPSAGGSSTFYKTNN